MSNKELIEQLVTESGKVLQNSYSAMSMKAGNIIFRDWSQLEAFAKAYQAAAPTDNVAEALEKAVKICDDMGEKHHALASENKNHDYIAAGCDACSQAIEALIPDTQAKKGE
jgi:hypothetical protein